MRLQPDEGDTLFFITYRLVHPRTGDLMGDNRHGNTFAKNWVEACHMVRNQYGPERVDYIDVLEVYTIERLKSGDKIKHHKYQRIENQAA